MDMIYSFPTPFRNIRNKISPLQLFSPGPVQCGKRKQKHLKATVMDSIYQIWHRSRIRHEPRMIPEKAPFEFWIVSLLIFDYFLSFLSCRLRSLRIIKIRLSRFSVADCGFIKLTRSRIQYWEYQTSLRVALAYFQLYKSTDDRWPL